ncbi:MAG: hypothetical protein N0E48_15190 [Candidatus Thiodiazotropha endolucinida]|nr:hypothetical protein [Candidatus Thiodiazotropha taylori]MCW4344680.1 hypothetical protein [Candidatus Thiodiazotropha endolucinida]
MQQAGEDTADPEPNQLPEERQVIVNNLGNLPAISNNMASVFRLENFKGDGSQKVESYLKRFDQFKTCTGLNDDQALATLAWHLEGTARLWYEQLEPEPNNVNDLKQAMQAKFKKEKVVDMSVYSMKQQVGESVEDFLSRLEAETYTSNINSEIQVQIALHGMDRTISSAISTHAPKTLDQVKELTLRMASVKPATATVAQASAIPTRLESTVEVLTAAVAKLATTMEERERKQVEEGCPRCGGRCFSSSSCRAMGKTCYKCKKLNHFGNKCRFNKQFQNEQRSDRSGQRLDRSGRSNQYQNYPR